MKPNRNIIFLSAVIVFTSLGFKSPGGARNDYSRNHLFMIERNRDKDIIQYDVNLDMAGNLKMSDPFNIYWVRRSRNDELEPLTAIQNKLSYGIRVLDMQPEGERLVSFRFVSVPDRIFSLVRSGETYRVLLTTGDREIIVEKIYVEINGGSYLFPSVSTVELHGMETATGIPVMETINN